MLLSVNCHRAEMLVIVEPQQLCLFFVQFNFYRPVIHRAARMDNVPNVLNHHYHFHVVLRSNGSL